MKKYMIIFLIFLMCICSITAQAADLNMGVICYHSVTDNPLKLSSFVISDKEFEDDIVYFKNKGYKVLLPKEMWYANPNEKNIVFTFDDGYDDFYEVVFPLLKKYNIKAAVYIIGSEIDKKGYLKSWQIKELDNSGLVEIGNHTDIMHSYPYTVEDYSSNPKILNEYMEDVKACNNRLYKILGHGVESFAYPGGKYTEQMDKIIRTNLGYATTFTTDYGIVKTQKDITKHMKRIYRVHGDYPYQIEEKINSLK